MWHVTCDMWHVTRNTWHVIRDTWHLTRNTFGGVNILSKFQLPSSYRLWFMILWRYFRKRLTDLINQSVTRLFVGQPRLHRVCQKCQLICNGNNFFWIFHYFITFVSKVQFSFVTCYNLSFVTSNFIFILSVF